MDADATLAELLAAVTRAENSTSNDEYIRYTARVLDAFKALHTHLTKGGALPDGWRKPLIVCPHCGGDMTGNRNLDGTCAGHLVPPDVPLVTCKGTGQQATVIKYHD